MLKNFGGHLVCLGLGKDEEKLRELAKEKGVAERLIIPGTLPPEEVAGAIKGARALIFPSLAEGFGLPVLEAMALGTPVVIANRSPMKEIAAGCGYPFDPDWPESFNVAVKEALADNEERTRKIEAGKKEARKYSWRRTAHHIEDALYRAATGKLPPNRDQEPHVLSPLTAQ